MSELTKALEKHEKKVQEQLPFRANIFMRSVNHILNISENAPLQLSIFYEKVLDKKYLLKLSKVAQTSSKRFVETPPICLV